MVVPIKVTSMGQIDLSKIIYIEQEYLIPGGVLVGERSRGWPKGSLFNSYYTKV